jgi:hypothetical protein
MLALAPTGCTGHGIHPPSASSLPSTSARFSRHEYHYDRNALVSCALVGSSLLATAEAGHLLRFDRRTFALTGESLSARRARFVVPEGSNGALVAFQSGRIARIDATKFALETIAVVPGTPVWLGVWQGRTGVVVYGQPLAGTWSLGEQLSAYRVRVIASGLDVLVDEKPSAFLIDGRDRLWMGADYGEWGGALEVLDLTSGSVRELPDWGGRGVYGLAEPDLGVVWALGGGSHMGMYGAFVTRAAPEPVKDLYHFEGMAPLFARQQKAWFAASEPRVPLTHAFARPTGGVWLLSQHAFIEVDSELRRFKRVADLILKNVPGRPDAVGDYPAVRSAVSDRDRIVLATRLDGFVTLENGSVVPHGLPTRIVGSPSWVLPVPSGTLFWGDGRGSLRTATGDWKAIEAEIADDGKGGLTLSAESTPSSDPDIIAARSAMSRWLERPRERKGSLAEGRKLYAHVAWDAEHELAATDHGLCLSPREQPSECRPIQPEGLDELVTALARDGAGRLWLAGRGLWLMDGPTRAIPLRHGLPFLADAVVDDLVVIGEKLALILGPRGVAILDPRDLVQAAPGVSTSAWDLGLPHEPKYSDGELIVDFAEPPPFADDRTHAESRALFDRVRRAVRQSNLQAYEGFSYWTLSWQAPDPDALTRVVREALSREPRGGNRAVRMRVRRGPPGKPVHFIALPP